MFEVALAAVQLVPPFHDSSTQNFCALLAILTRPVNRTWMPRIVLPKAPSELCFVPCRARAVPVEPSATRPEMLPGVGGGPPQPGSWNDPMRVRQLNEVVVE